MLLAGARGYRGRRRLAAPLCAPCAMSDIVQKKYWERYLSGNNIEVVALPGAVCTGKFTLVPLFRRVAAAPYPARGSCGLLLIYPLARLKLPVLAASKSLRRSRKAGAARMDAG